jgi:glycosyltransferase involved in cell wall biosynthesis
MLLYMACGLPVVVSNFGMNSNLLAQKFIGYGAISEKDWFVALDSLINDDALRKKAGQNGRNLVVSNYSTDVVAKKWISVLDEVLNKN